jgi:hypothetical protein
MGQEGVKHVYPSRPLPPRVLPAETVEHTNLRTVFGAWEGIRGAAAFPSDPTSMLRPIKHLLKFIHLSDVVDRGNAFRFRLLGEAVFPGLEASQKGRLVSEHPDPGIRLRYGSLMRSVVETRAPVRGLATRLTDDPQHNYEIESLWLPFGSENEVTQILSLAAFERLRQE